MWRGADVESKLEVRVRWVIVLLLEIDPGEPTRRLRVALEVVVEMEVE